MKKIPLDANMGAYGTACNCSAVPQMGERGLYAIHQICGQADDKADVVLLNSYGP